MAHEFVNKEVLCRKSHRCEWCDEIINPGEYAQYREYVFEGFMHGYMHPECYQAAQDYPDQQELVENGWYAGDFKRGSTATW